MFIVKRYFSEITLFCNILRFEYLLNETMEFGALLSKFQNKLHDFTMRANKHPKANIVFSTVFVAMATKFTLAS